MQWRSVRYGVGPFPVILAALIGTHLTMRFLFRGAIKGIGRCNAHIKHRAVLNTVALCKI